MIPAQRVEHKEIRITLNYLLFLGQLDIPRITNNDKVPMVPEKSTHQDVLISLGKHYSTIFFFLLFTNRNDHQTFGEEIHLFRPFFHLLMTSSRLRKDIIWISTWSSGLRECKCKLYYKAIISSSIFLFHLLRQF